MSLDLNTTLALQNVSNGHADAVTKKTAQARQHDAFDAVAQEFEAVFIAEMMKPMFEGLEVDATFGGGKGEEVFRSMLVQEYGKIMAQTGQLGIASAVKAQLIEMQSGLDTDATAINANDNNVEQESTRDDAANL